MDGLGRDEAEEGEQKDENTHVSVGTAPQSSYLLPPVHLFPAEYSVNGLSMRYNDIYLQKMATKLQTNDAM